MRFFVALFCIISLISCKKKSDDKQSKYSITLDCNSNLSAITRDNNFLILGKENYKNIITKLSIDGHEKWIKFFNIGFYFLRFNELSSGDLNFVLINDSYDEIAVLETDATCNTKWLKNFSLAYKINNPKIHLNNDGSFLFTGFAYTISGSIEVYSGIYQFTINQTGDTINSKFKSKIWNENPIDLLASNDGGFVCMKFINSTAYIQKILNNDSVQWSTPISGNFYFYDTNIRELNNDDFLVLCQNNLRLIRINNQGNILWDKKFHYPSASITAGNSYIECSDENLIIVGYVMNSVGNQSNLYISKIDKNGNEIWSKVNQSSMSVSGRGIFIIDNNYYISIHNYEMGNSTNCFNAIQKMDSNGNFL